jgi:hypothetical protein
MTGKPNAQVLGDCRTLYCDGTANGQDFADTYDRPDDQNPCTLDMCQGFDAKFTFQDGYCSNGKCSNGQCIPQQCNGPDQCVFNDCMSTAACSEGLCFYTPKKQGALCSHPHDGGGQCNGGGICLDCVDNGGCDEASICVDLQCVIAP